MRRVIFLLCFLAMSVGGGIVQAAPDKSAGAKSQAPASDLLIRKRIEALVAKVVPGRELISVSKAPFGNMYQVNMTGNLSLLISKKGDYLVVGDLYSVNGDTVVNLSDNARSNWRLAELGRVKRRDMIIFSPPKNKIKRHVFIFTDVDCGYCRKLHQQADSYNRLGIELRYLAYPRAGVGSATYNKMVSAWCAKDSGQKLTQLKNGQNVSQRLCVDNPVADQFELGQRLGINGTPAIFTDRGQMFPGYLPPDELARKMGVR